jgi:hypothetical protein
MGPAVDYLPMLDAAFSGRIGGFYGVIAAFLATGVLLMNYYVVKKGVMIIVRFLKS